MGHFPEGTPLFQARQDLKTQHAEARGVLQRLGRAIAAAHLPDLITRVGVGGAARDGAVGELCSVSVSRAGVLFVGPGVPDGAIKLTDGDPALLWHAIYGSARLGYDGKTWLVPGIPEAESDDAAVDALISYQKRIIAAVELLETGTISDDLCSVSAGVGDA